MSLRENLQLRFCCDGGDRRVVWENETNCTGFRALGLLHWLIHQNWDLTRLVLCNKCLINLHVSTLLQQEFGSSRFNIQASLDRRGVVGGREIHFDLSFIFQLTVLYPCTNITDVSRIIKTDKQFIKIFTFHANYHNVTLHFY